MKRRRLLTLTGVATLGVLTRHRVIAAESLQPLDTSHPPAKALAYVEDAADADPSRYQSGSRCDNCIHYQPQGSSADRGGCALFPGFSVTAAGWCAGWVAQSSQSG